MKIEFARSAPSTTTRTGSVSRKKPGVIASKTLRRPETLKGTATKRTGAHTLRRPEQDTGPTRKGLPQPALYARVRKTCRRCCHTILLAAFSDGGRVVAAEPWRAQRLGLSCVRRRGVMSS